MDENATESVGVILYYMDAKARRGMPEYWMRSEDVGNRPAILKYESVR